MNCEQARHVLSLEPKGTLVPRGHAVRSHLDRCRECRSYWCALMGIDRALAARPLATPPWGFLEGVMGQVRRFPRRDVTPPFSRGFMVASAFLALCALVGGAWLLHHWSAMPPSGSGLAGLWLGPAWASDASVWLSHEGESIAQVILPVVAGALITLATVGVGFRASQRREVDSPQAKEQAAPPRV